MLFVIGDYLAGASIGVVTAAGIRALVWPGMDMVVAMLAGTLLGTAAHVVVLVLLGPLVGFFHVMAPGALVGMYGGMLFGMRDSMQAVTWSGVVAVAVAVGILGAGYAVGKIGSAALGAAAEKPELLIRSLLFVALAEGLAVLGFAIAMMLIACLTTALVTNSGRSAWFLGCLVVVVYLVFALTLYLLPPRVS